jgi:hypothetical protein
MPQTFICDKFLTMTENNDQLSVYLLKLHASAGASSYCSFVALKEVRIVNKREVRRHGDGWGVFAPNARRASVVKPTQAEAQASGRTILINQGGGELLTRGQNGQIRQQDTIKPGNDPRSRKG